MRTWLKCVVTLALVTATGYALDRLLRREGVSARELLILSDFLVGLVAAALVFILSIYHERRSRYVETRLNVIAQMNHHIRNALQVITFHVALGKDEKEISAMRQAVNRITWALAEVLPHFPERDDSPAIADFPLAGPGARQSSTISTATSDDNEHPANVV